MATAVVSAFVVGWLASLIALGTLVALAVRVSRRDKSLWPPVLRQWHAAFSWPVHLARPAIWSDATDKTLAKVTQRCVVVAALLLVPVIGAYTVLGGR
jgi:hypothetical protein